MGTTSDFDLRYPETTSAVTLAKYFSDLAHDAAAALKGLANRILALETGATPGPWRVPSSTSAVNLELGDGCRFRVTGRWVELAIYITTTSSIANGGTLFTLPADARPDRTWAVTVSHAAGGLGQGAQIMVNPNGTVTTVGTVPAGESRRGAFTFQRAL